MKQCTKCGVEKALSEFWQDGRRGRGRAFAGRWCRSRIQGPRACDPMHAAFRQAIEVARDLVSGKR